MSRHATDGETPVMRSVTEHPPGCACGAHRERCPCGAIAEMGAVKEGEWDEATGIA